MTDFIKRRVFIKRRIFLMQRTLNFGFRQSNMRCQSAIEHGGCHLRIACTEFFIDGTIALALINQRCINPQEGIIQIERAQNFMRQICGNLFLQVSPNVFHGGAGDGDAAAHSIMCEPKPTCAAEAGNNDGFHKATGIFDAAYA